MRGRVVAVLCAALLSAVFALPLGAQETAEIAGSVRNGTPGADFDPAEVRLSLNVLEGVVSISETTTAPDASGRFAFAGVPVGPERVYFVSAEYGGAAYSASLRTDELAAPVEITVYEPTASTDALRVESHSVIVTGADANARFIEVFERAHVANDSGRTLVPDLSAQGPAMLSFLRFALPPGAFHLDVRSDLVGGDVLTVDRGFALNIPVPPTPAEQPHRFEFVYRLPYESGSVDLGRTMRFGAGAFRFVIPVSVGVGASPDLTDLGATAFEGGQLQLLEGSAIPRDGFLPMSVNGLPQPTLWGRVESRGGEWFLRYAVPGAAAVALAAALAFAARRRAPVAQLSREALLARAAALREQREGVSRRRYNAEREQIRRALIALESASLLEEEERPPNA
ncbi:MAG: hypothetical protein OXI25_03720 [Chloroflexota bacterium]|nr:hypothetical protein [Chloroflexota bacterium]